MKLNAMVSAASALLTNPLSHFSSFRDEIKSNELFVSKTLDAWQSWEGLNHKGLLVERSFDGAFDCFDREIDQVTSRFGQAKGYGRTVLNGNERQVTGRFRRAADEIVARAKLPDALTDQVRSRLPRGPCVRACAISSLRPNSHSVAARARFAVTHAKSE